MQGEHCFRFPIIPCKSLIHTHTQKRARCITKNPSASDASLRPGTVSKSAITHKLVLTAVGSFPVNRCKCQSHSLYSMDLIASSYHKCNGYPVHQSEVEA